MRLLTYLLRAAARQSCCGHAALLSMAAQNTRSQPSFEGKIPSNVLLRDADERLNDAPLIRAREIAEADGIRRAVFKTQEMQMLDLFLAQRRMDKVFRAEARADALLAQRQQRFDVLRGRLDDGLYAGAPQQLAPDAPADVRGMAKDKGTVAQAAQIARAQRRLVHGEVKAAAVDQRIRQAEDDHFLVKVAQLDLLWRLRKRGNGKVDIAVRQ